MAKLWGGRFTQSTDSFTDHFHSSISFDSRMYKEPPPSAKAYAFANGGQGESFPLRVSGQSPEVLVLVVFALVLHHHCTNLHGQTEQVDVVKEAMDSLYRL